MGKLVRFLLPVSIVFLPPNSGELWGQRIASLKNKALEEMAIRSFNLALSIREVGWRIRKKQSIG